VAVGSAQVVKGDENVLESMIEHWTAGRGKR